MPVCSFAQMGTLVVRPKQKATEIVRGRMENIAVRAACLGFPGILQPPHWCHHLLRRTYLYSHKVLHKLIMHMPSKVSMTFGRRWIL